MSGSFLEHQARIGISVHMGGWPATRQLLALCHVAEASEVLEIGCGIGVGSVAIARMHGGRVVGVDVSPRMIDWARRRARDAGVEDRVSFAVADVLRLPFEDDRFDAVIAESVLAFIEDKACAIAEMVRVTKPGGYVGLNEGFLLTETPTPRVARLTRQIGSAMVTLPTWRALWAESGLEERAVRTYRVDAARMLRDRFRWVGLPRLAAGALRAGLLYLTDPATRPVLHAMSDALRAGSEEAPGTPPPWASFGYGLFVGRRPVLDVPRTAGRVARGRAREPSHSRRREAEPSSGDARSLVGHVTGHAARATSRRPGLRGHGFGLVQRAITDHDRRAGCREGSRSRARCRLGHR